MKEKIAQTNVPEINPHKRHPGRRLVWADAEWKSGGKQREAWRVVIIIITDEYKFAEKLIEMRGYTGDMF